MATPLQHLNSQFYKFKETGRALECDDGERFKERVKKLVRQKPVEPKPE
jgi:hypothetical protein